MDFWKGQVSDRDLYEPGLHRGTKQPTSIESPLRSGPRVEVSADESGDAILDRAEATPGGKQGEPSLAKPKRMVRADVVRKRGKAPGLTPRIIEQVVFAIRHGASISQAAVAEGVHRRTILKWLRRGQREADGPFAELSRQVMLARRERVVPPPIDKIIGVFKDGHQQPKSLLSLQDLAGSARFPRSAMLWATRSAASQASSSYAAPSRATG